MSGTCVDITERKCTEAVLLESEGRYRDVFENNTAVKLLIDPKTGQIVEANSAAGDFYGYARDKLKKLRIWDISASGEHWVKKRLDEATQVETRQFECQHRLASGEIRDVHLHTGPVSVDGRLLLHSIVVDITERKRGERAIEQMHRLERFGTLAGGIAHDFNNVLTGVFGHVSPARLALENDLHVHKFLEEAEKSIHRATRLSTQLLTFAKGGTPVKENVNLKELITSVTCFDVTGSNIKPNFYFQQPLHDVYADQGQLQQLISNLTFNAAQVMQDGGIIFISAQNIVISRHDFRCLTEGDYVVVTVRDNGPGIREADIKRVFEPYFSTKNTGHGLGLATCYSIIQKHKGHVEVSSQPNSGATFTILRPASPNSVAPRASRSVESSLQPLNLTGKRVLVMDDQQADSAGNSQHAFQYGDACRNHL